MRIPLLPSIAACLLLLSACGGSGPVLGLGIPLDGALNTTFPFPLRSREGSFSSDGSTVPKATLLVGDDDLDRSWRAFTSFALEDQETGQTLERATLRLHQGGLMGDPYQHMGLLYAELIDMGAGLDASDWAPTASAGAPGWSEPTLGPIEIDVTALVEEALALGRDQVDIRIRFSLTVVADGTPQQTQFTSFDKEVEPISLPPLLELAWRTTP